MICVNFPSHQRWRLIGLSLSGIQDPTSSKTFLGSVYSLWSCRALISGGSCFSEGLPGLVCCHNISIGVGCRENLDTISCHRRHHAKVFNLHAASRRVFHMVLDCHHGHFIWGLHLVISDGDRLWYWLLLPWTQLEIQSALSSPGPVQWLNGSCVRQHHSYCEYY